MKTQHKPPLIVIAVLALITCPEQTSPNITLASLIRAAIIMAPIAAYAEKDHIIAVAMTTATLYAIAYVAGSILLIMQ